MRWRSAFVVVAALSAGARADDAPGDRIARLKTAERTIELVSARDREVRSRVAARVRAYVKAERSGLARLWVEPGGRMDFLARRAAMTRLLRRDLRELAVMEAEHQVAASARERLHGELAAPEPSSPAPGSLVRPVARARLRTGFGVQRHRESQADMSARGIELACRPGDPVLAVAAGRVLWTGSLSGASAVLVDHGGFVSVLVGMGRVGVATGQAVAAGQVLGNAAGDELHVEIRLRSGAFGNPVDPTLLFAR
jgi:murein DD-endopeptidase MepM/ murein hydrolase activator NlpD